MRFGELIQEKRVPGWEGYYVDYELLKKQLLMLASQPARLQLQGEFQFKSAVEDQLKIVNVFFEKKLQELQHSLDPLFAKPANPTRQGWIQTADELATRLAQLEEYAFLNYEGFRKILKKHDKNCQVPMMQSFLIDLQHNEHSFWKQSEKLRSCVDGLVALYERGGRYENLEVVSIAIAEANEANDFAEGGVKKAFVRKNSKFWVPRHRLMELMSRLSAFMPLYYFAEKGVDPLLSSVYLDNESMVMYGPRLRRGDGATLIRLRVYGDDHPSMHGACFVERKTHCEKIYGGTSKKERYQISEADVDTCLDGGFVELANEGKRDRELANEVAAEIATKGIRPFTTTRYRRCVFQKNTDDRLRISIDRNLTMSKEFHIAQWKWHEHLSRPLHSDELYDFPYAVMELKLRDVEMPHWFEALIRENLVLEIPKFSKFIHSCVAFRRTAVPELPYWVEDYRSDFGFLNAVETDERGSTHASENIRMQAKPIQPMGFDASGDATSCQCLPPMITSRYRKMREGNQKTGGGRPQKMDPKAFLANERTFLNWNQQAITLCTFGVALLSIDTASSSLIAGLMMVLVGIFVLVYGQYQYFKRWTHLRNRSSGLNFLDIYGPVLLTVFLIATFTLAIVFRISPPGTGQNIVSKMGLLQLDDDE